MFIQAAKAYVKLLIGRGVRYSYGQFGEDAVVQSMLKRSKNKTFVDVGAYHPTLYSNTYALYRLGWQGLAIDPNPAMAPLFRTLRPRDTFIRAAIGNGKGTYHLLSDGAYNTFDSNEVQKLTESKGLRLVSTEELVFRRLDTVLTDAHVDTIGFLNIDVEGRDLEVLETHNWSIRPELIAVEDHSFVADSPQGSKTYLFLQEKGYRLAGFCGKTLLFTSSKFQ